MSPIAEEKSIENEADGDQPLPKSSGRTNKKVVIFESRSSKDKMFVLDLQKIRQNLHNRISQVYEQVKQNPDECASKSQESGKLDNSGEAFQKCDKKPNKAKGKACVKGVPAVAPAAVPAENGDDTNECAKVLRKMAEETFCEGLKKHGYKVASANAFVAEGGYGSVFRVQKGTQRFACKVISNLLFQLKAERGPLNTIKLRSRFSNEIEIMRRVSSHSNIIKYVESFTDEMARDLPEEDNSESASENSEEGTHLSFKNFFIIMEYANAKTLSFYVKNRRSLPENTVKGILQQLTDAVKFMHHSQIAHRDIKLSNLLLQSKKSNSPYRSNAFNYMVKLCDFGLSTIVDPEDNCFMKPVGTSFYMDPDILRAYYFYNRKKIDQIVPYCAFKGDVWALGVSIFYCLHGYYPLDILCKGSKTERMDVLDKIFSLADAVTADKTLEEIYGNRFRNALRNYHNKLSFNCQELLRRMLEVDAKKRADIFEIASHVYLR